ncbi:hypothetical protein chiPu_0027184, partial [Chiloscyllium punctatum]|nr:hypothetical protein [Chiloscyllium punctatum]
MRRSRSSGCREGRRTAAGGHRMAISQIQVRPYKRQHCPPSRPDPSQVAQGSAHRGWRTTAREYE